VKQGQALVAAGGRTAGEINCASQAAQDVGVQWFFPSVEVGVGDWHCRYTAERALQNVRRLMLPLR
jgi:hypothetical protein